MKKSQMGWYAGVSLSLLMLASCAPDATQDPAEVPDNTAGAAGRDGQAALGERNFATLMNSYNKGVADPTPWGGSWWPYSSNGIASGSHNSGKESPAGKYDRVRGACTGENAQNWEVKNHGTGVKNAPGWAGHCNGWSAAGALFPEPNRTKKVNGVEFTIADQKALLTEVGMEVDLEFFGNRSDMAHDEKTKKLWWDDTVPDQMFLVLTNYMGKEHAVVNMDQNTDVEVWNQPMAAFNFDYPTPEDYLGPGTTPDTQHVYRIQLTGHIYWVSDFVSAGVQTPRFTWTGWENSYDDNNGQPIFDSRTLKMEIWLDAPVVFDPQTQKIKSAGNVIVAPVPGLDRTYVGGSWVDEGYVSRGHPDYMWIPYSILPPTGDANPKVDAGWLADHLIKEVDDRSVQPCGGPLTPPPLSTPTPNPIPTHPPIPFPLPTTMPTGSPHP